MSKPISFRLNDKVVEKLNYYSAITGKTKANLLEDALEHEFDNIKRQRSGGFSLSLPNSQMVDMPSDEDIKELEEVCKALNSKYGLNFIVQYLKARKEDSEDIKKQFAANFIQDLTYEQNL
mgnify:FL=1